MCELLSMSQVFSKQVVAAAGVADIDPWGRGARNCSCRRAPSERFFFLLLVRLILFIIPSCCFLLAGFFRAALFPLPPVALARWVLCYFPQVTMRLLQDLGAPRVMSPCIGLKRKRWP